jgi:hypothetical protein
LAEKAPGWVERLLVPTLESRVRAIVNEEVGRLEKNMEARLEAVDQRFDAVDSTFDALETRMESLEGRIPMIQDIADLKARLAVVEKRSA